MPGLDDLVFIDAEPTLARESPAMIPLDLGGAEDRSLADAFPAIDALFAPVAAGGRAADPQPGLRSNGGNVRADPDVRTRAAGSIRVVQLGGEA